MRNRIGDDQRILHILDAIKEIEIYNKGIDLAEFKGNSMIRFASVKQLEIIGEAAKNVTLSTKSAFPNIEWEQVSALRNILVHEYFGIDFDLVWQIIQVDVQDLKKSLETFKR
jgi:uncharacterized protein with HEPN domain